jgi:hypothetical protein
VGESEPALSNSRRYPSTPRTRFSVINTASHTPTLTEP